MAGVNVLGEPLEPCGFAPLTGFWRDGSCRTGGEDVGAPPRPTQTPDRNAPSRQVSSTTNATSTWRLVSATS